MNTPRILDLGAGTGLFSSLLLQKYPEAEITLIDLSALSIHHLSDLNKRELYKNSYLNLKENGVFINADQVLGHTSFIESLYKNDWKKKAQINDHDRLFADRKRSHPV